MNFRQFSGAVYQKIPNASHQEIDTQYKAGVDVAAAVRNIRGARKAAKAARRSGRFLETSDFDYSMNG